MKYLIALLLLASCKPSEKKPAQASTYSYISPGFKPKLDTLKKNQATENYPEVIYNPGFTPLKPEDIPSLPSGAIIQDSSNFQKPVTIPPREILPGGTIIMW